MTAYREVLFTGDSLMRKKDGVAIVPALFSEDRDRNRASLSALEPLAFTTIADGHRRDAGCEGEARKTSPLTPGGRRRDSSRNRYI